MILTVQGADLGVGPADALLSAFIVEEMTRIEESVARMPDDGVPLEVLNPVAWKEFGV